jgi:hypothetical protein
MGADRLDPFDDGPDLVLRGPLFHHDHHLSLKPLKSSTYPTSVRMRNGVRRGDVSSGGGLDAAAAEPDA